MKWKGRKGSSNVDDRRRMGGGKAAGGLGLGTIVIVLIIWALGGNPMQVLQQMGTTTVSTGSQQTYTPTAEEDEMAEFISVVLQDTEDVWNKLFGQSGQNYPEPTLVLFTGTTSSGCGHANSATGPFYCPADRQVYIDLSFFKLLRDRFNAPGDFAMAYVVAHEVAHHIQNVQGYTDYVHQQRGKVSQAQYNKLSVMLELQADFLAGVWAHHAQSMKGILEEGDIEEALAAANAIGDDRLQKQSQGYVVPDSFTHGTSKQRMYWFMKGFKTGDINQGDTFNDPSLQ